jgi:mRNA interferase MazF
LDPTVDSDQADRRPVLIVSNEDKNQLLPNVTVLPLTTKRDVYPGEVFLPARAAGQPQDSIIMAHQIRSISKSRMIKLYGYLTDSGLRLSVQDAIIDHLDLQVQHS